MASAWGCCHGGSLLALADLVVLIGGEAPLMVVGLIPAIALVIAAVTMIYRYSRFSAEGQQIAVTWQAYRHGLAEATKDPRAVFDLDTVVPDLIATGGSFCWARSRSGGHLDGALLGHLFRGLHRRRRRERRDGDRPGGRLRGRRCWLDLEHYRSTMRVYRRSWWISGRRVGSLSDAVTCATITTLSPASMTS